MEEGLGARRAARPTTRVAAAREIEAGCAVARVRPASPARGKRAVVNQARVLRYRGRPL